MTQPAVQTSRPDPASFDVEAVRSQFPILERRIHGHPLVFLDSAASAQKPLCVLDAIEDCYRHHYANVHRGVHTLSQEATALYEEARQTARAFLNGGESREVIFLGGTTDAVNLVAQSYGRSLQPGDEILLTELEHHSNIVPWQLVCEATGARIVVAPINDRGEVELDAFAAKLSERTRIAAFAHISNSLGTINPVRRMTELAHAAGAQVLIDGAQAAPHIPIDVQEIGCDYYAFSGHKVFGPNGIGVLWGRAELLESLPPYRGGGEMIHKVSFAGSTWADIPHKFEAGTPNIAGAIGLAAALRFVRGLDAAALARHEHALLEKATGALETIPGLRIVGRARQKSALVSFTLDGVHAHDIGTILDAEGVAVRTGHHCAQPVMQHFGVAATARASFALYNTLEEVDRLVAALDKVREVFA